MKTTEKTRFDARLPKEQKQFFEYAASLGGFRSLTEFLVSAAQQRAKQIIDEHNTILASQRDRDLFFKTISNPAKPNAKLKKAAVRFNKAIG